LHELLLQPPACFCGEAATSEELQQQLPQQDWQIMVLDMCLPDQTKLQTVRTLHRRYPGVPILALAFSSGIARRHWQEAGASGFVSKAHLSTDFREAVRIIGDGGTYFTDERRGGTRP
jgi:DNA-binding NarL/FixJ family response regulator